LRGADLTVAASPVAREVVERAERVILSERDSARVLKLLENPPKPTRALLAAARRRADLLLAAGIRALSVADRIGGVALAIDAKDERAASWYQRFGAIRLLDDPLKLILALGAIADAVAAADGKRRQASGGTGGP